MRLFKHPYSGRYYVEFWRGKTRSLKTTDKAKALKIYRKIEREYLAKRISKLDSDDKRITLSAFRDRFLAEHTEISVKTKKQYDLALRLLIDSVGGSTLMSRVSRLVGKFVSDCDARGCRPVSVNSYLRHIKGALYKAHEWGLLENRPKIKMKRQAQALPMVLTQQEIAKILRYSRRNDYEMYRIILFALWTGARRAEIASARYEKINSGVIRLVGKGDRERTIPLLPMSSFAIGQQQDIGRIFHKFHVYTITHRFQRIAGCCGVSARFHSLRHTSATMMLAAGIDLAIVQKILGHASITTTQIYAKVLDKAVEKEMWKLALKLH